MGTDIVWPVVNVSTGPTSSVTEVECPVRVSIITSLPSPWMLTGGAEVPDQPPL